MPKENNEEKPVKEEKDRFELPGLEPVERYHEMELGGETRKYMSRAGVLPLKDDKGEIEAEIFFTAYELGGDTPPADRPLTFVFNGGPGSSSVWLHMGAIGPKRVVMEPEGWMPRPPFRLEDNRSTWLDRTDLVFIDPVETGYSRCADEAAIDKYWGYKGDLESVGRFIRQYLSRYGRWDSPLFLAGESYGTTRAAGLAGDLFFKGVAFNGIVLISTAVDLQPIRFTEGDDLPCQLFVPTYTAAAWYHKRLPEELQKRKLTELLDEVAAWSESDLTVALMKGDRLSREELERTAEKLAWYTGLDVDYVKGSNLRINIHRFCRELLRDGRRSVGRLDARFTGIEPDQVREYPQGDPSMAAIMPAYTSLFNSYAVRELGVETHIPYRIMHHFENRKWKWENGELPRTGEILRFAMAKNTYMKVLVAQGFYDLATPHFATEYMISHMNMDPEVRKNLWMRYYEAGHMFYLDTGCLRAFREDAEEFFRGACPC